MDRWSKALRLETRVAQIIQQQEVNGVAFDIGKAHAHVARIEGLKDELYKGVRPYLRMELSVPYPKPIEKPFKANGDYRETVLKWFPDNPEVVGGPFTRMEFLEPDLGSRQKLTRQLLDAGWKPEMYTDKGTPKLTDKGEPVPSLLRIEGKIGKSLAEWYVLSHRQSQIKGWIERVRPDGRITAGANSCGTNTCRMRHRGVVNVPKAADNVVFGYEMRDLFITRNGYKMVGHDASGLEARMMGHYTFPLDGGEFAKEILEGDVHTKNAKAFFPKQTRNLNRGDKEFDDVWRNLAKTLFYGLIYGAQVGKVQSIIGCTRKEAEEVFETFWGINPGLGKLREKVIKLADRNGWVPGLDGRKIYIRSSHSALNALFQSGGAIVMKGSMVILDYWVRKAGLDVTKVIDMHDEAQAEVPESDIVVVRGTKEEVEDAIQTGIWSAPHELGENEFEYSHCAYGELAVKSIRAAGKQYGLRCDLDAEYKVGRSWAETH